MVATLKNCALHRASGGIEDVVYDELVEHTYQVLESIYMK